MICEVCKSAYKADVEGSDDPQHPVCVACITNMFNGAQLTPNYKVQSLTLAEFRDRMKQMKGNKVHKVIRMDNKQSENIVNSLAGPRMRKTGRR